MKTILITFLMTWVIPAEARLPACYEIAPLFLQMKRNHVKNYNLDQDYIKDSLNQYFMLKDYRAVLFYGKERDNILSKYQDKSAEIYKELTEGSCETYEKIDQEFKKYADRWESAAIKQAGANKFPIKEIKELDRKKTEPRTLIDKEEYLTVIKNFLNDNYSHYLKLKNKKNFQKYIESSLKKKKRIISDEEYLPAIILKSLVRTLDPHSDYMTDYETENFNEDLSANKVGMGVEIYQTDTGGLKIEKVFKDSSAESAGVKEGDEIIEVEGLGVSEYSFNSIMSVIAGDEGSSFNMIVKRGSVEKKFKIIRKRFSLSRNKLESKQIVREDKKILYMYLPAFYYDPVVKKGPAEDIKDSLKKNPGMDLIILDLRNNGGGRLDQAIDTVAIFKKDPLVVSQKDQKGNIHKLGGKSEFLDEKTPLIILMNNRSASASEIVAGALQDYERAIIIGDKNSYGKGTIQQIYPITSTYMSVLGMTKITNGLFFLPKGETTQFQGVISDIEIPRDDFYEIGEREFSNALKPTTIPSMLKISNSYREEMLDKLKSSIPSGEVKVSEAKTGEDLVLERALDISGAYLKVLNSKIDN